MTFELDSLPGAAPCCEDWTEITAMPMPPSYLLVPRRTRIRDASPGGSAVKLSNSFDCVLLWSSPAGDLQVAPASSSRFCRRVMATLRDAGATCPAVSS